ncbi:MAG: hypothetical protein WBE72_15845 [Terracidiphilus sp.]
MSRRIFAKAAVGVLLAAATATAQSSTPIGGVTKSDAVWIGIAVGAIGAGVGIGIYYAVHHGHSLTGCAASGPIGLELQGQGNQETYALAGEVDGIRPGERVRVSGKREKTNAGAPPQFLVEKMSRDYGPCK